MTVHLTSAEIERYLGRTLAPAELLALHQHVRECAPCREALAAEAFARAPGWTGPLGGGAGALHLSEEEMVAWAAQRMPAARRREAAAHLAACAECGDAVAAMEGERERIRARAWFHSRWFAPALAAAAVLLVAVAVYRRPAAPPPLLASLRDGGAVIGLNARGELRGLNAASPQEREWVRQTLGSSALPAVPGMDGEGRGVLRGAPAAAPSGFRVVAPLDTRVLEDRPRFGWEPEPGARQYQVVVTDQSLQVLARSQRVSGTEWQPPVALPRGVVLLWQVRALGGATEITTPAPPDPPARFEIASAEVAARILSLRAAPQPSHLLLAVICAHAGLREEAARELALLGRENPQAAWLRGQTLR